MHALDTLDAIVQFLSQSLSDRLLPTASGEEKSPTVYDGYAPPKPKPKRNKDEDDPTDVDCPFVIVRYLDDNDVQYQSNKVAYRIIVATYSEDEQHGWRENLSLMIHIKSMFREQQFIGSANLVGKIETVLFEEQRKPYYHGYLVVEFEIPQIEEKNKELMERGFY